MGPENYTIIDIVLQLNGTLYDDNIWVPTQSWYNAVMT